jgi:hypothetical protein
VIECVHVFKLPVFRFVYVCVCVDKSAVPRSAERGCSGTGIEADPHIVRCLAADSHRCKRDL